VTAITPVVPSRRAQMNASARAARYNAKRRQARADAKARAARDDLATKAENLKLVRSIAARVIASLPSQFDVDDLIGEGMLALAEAAAKYDPANHGETPASAFLRKRIRGAMLESVRRNRYTENTRQSIDQPGMPDARSEENLRRSETEAHKALARLAHLPTAPISIDRAIRNRRVSAAIAWLPAAERQVLATIYGGSGLEIAAAARLLGISRGRASRLHGNAIRELAARLTGGALPKREPPKVA